MKKLLIVDVPEGEEITSIEIRTFDAEIGMTRHPKWEIITPPTEEEIYNTFPYVPNDRIYNLRQLDKRVAVEWLLKRFGL
jgi:hypothetical protein